MFDASGYPVCRTCCKGRALADLGNGCGPGSGFVAAGTRYLLNLGVVGGFFKAAETFAGGCNIHDQCFNILGEPRAYCDNLLHSVLRQLCGRAVKYGQASCYSVAYGTWLAVR